MFRFTEAPKGPQRYHDSVKLSESDLTTMSKTSAEDVQDTIKWLKRIGQTKAAEMMQAKLMKPKSK